jgi:hypothetical protein
MAAFEWAQIECYDGAAYPPLTPADLAGRPAGTLRLGLQPQLRLLALPYPVDEYALTLKQGGLRADASNAVGASPHAGRSATRRLRRPKHERVFLAVHRHAGRIYYKRLTAPAFKILLALRAGRPLAPAVAAAGRGVRAEQVREWFATWMQLGWFCRRRPE